MKSNCYELVESIIDKYTIDSKKPIIDNIKIDIKCEGQPYKVIRLNDEQYRKLSQTSIPIDDDYFHLLSLSNTNEIFSNCAKLYVSLKLLFGESGFLYDDYKGSFAFPFLILFEKKKKEYAYLLRIYNNLDRGEYIIRKIIHVEDTNYTRDVYHKPFDEFPREKIRYFMNFICGYLEGFLEVGKDQYNESFYHNIDSSLFIFGYKDDDFFEYEFETEEEYDKALEELRSNCN